MADTVAIPVSKIRRPRPVLKGRPVDPVAREEVARLLEGAPLDAQYLIENLHRIQDKFGHLSAAHMNALAEAMRLAQAEVYEVATFYHHFDVVKEGESAPPQLTVRVCETLSCAMAGAQQLID
jgi:formate dehydrogenase